MFNKDLALVYFTFFALVTISNANSSTEASAGRDKAPKINLATKIIFCGKCKDNELRASIDSYKQCFKEFFPDINMEAEKIVQENNNNIDICGEKIVKLSGEKFASKPKDVLGKYATECLSKVPKDLSKCI